MLTSRKEHSTSVKRVFKYMCGTTDYAICYRGEIDENKEVNVHGFVDPKWDRDIDCRWLIIGYVFNIFSGVVNWMSKTKFFIALSTTKAKTMVATHACKELIWLQTLCSYVGFDYKNFSLDCDN